jgi:hypothetical protein
MKDLGEAVDILGIKIYRDRSKRLIGLNQSAYIDKVLNRYNMQDSKKGFVKVITPGTVGRQLRPKNPWYDRLPIAAHGWGPHTPYQEMTLPLKAVHMGPNLKWTRQDGEPRSHSSTHRLCTGR